MVTVGFLLSQFQWNVLDDHPSLVARQQSFAVKFPPIHDFNFNVLFSFPDNMTDSKTCGSSRVDTKNIKHFWEILHGGVELFSNLFRILGLV